MDWLTCERVACTAGVRHVPNNFMIGIFNDGGIYLEIISVEKTGEGKLRIVNKSQFLILFLH